MADAVSATGQPAQEGQQPQDAGACEDRHTWAARIVAELRLGDEWAQEDPYADDEGAPGEWEGEGWRGAAAPSSEVMPVV